MRRKYGRLDIADGGRMPLRASAVSNQRATAVYRNLPLHRLSEDERRAYSTTVAVPLNGFAVTEGEVEIGGLHGERLHHRHCPRCKSWVYTDFEPVTGFVNVRATMLDHPSWFTPFIENYTSEALPWALVTGAIHSFEKFPSMEQYQPLLVEFAAR